MTQATINGNTYSDDSSTVRHLDNGGHEQWFLPLLQDVAIVAGQVAANAGQVALDTDAATDAAGSFRATSETSLTVSAGLKTMTVQAGKQLAPGNYVTISRTSAPSTKMHGTVTGYDGTSLAVDVAVVAGSGTFDDWTIAISGPAGVQGQTGDGALTYIEKVGAYTVTAEDKAKVIDCRGSFTLSFQPCATLGESWSTWVKNSGTGKVTLEPNGSELINGGATYTLHPDFSGLLMCDGSELRFVAKAGRVLARMPILSAETLGREAASVLENIEGEIVNTGLGVVVRVVWCPVEEVFVAFSYTTTATANIATSPDGVTWTLRSMPSSAGWSVVPGPAGWLAIANSGTTTAFSDNAGVSWSSRTNCPINAASVTISGSRILCITGATAAYTDNYGSTWSTADLPASISRVAAIGGVFLAFLSSGSTYYTSSTGATGSWESRTAPIQVTPTAMKIGDETGSSVFIFQNDPPFPIYTSTDGINWSFAGNNYESSTFSVNGVFVAFSSTFGKSKTWHRPGVPIVRDGSVTLFAVLTFGRHGNGSGVSVVGVGTGAGSVVVFNNATYNKTGLFEV